MDRITLNRLSVGGWDADGRAGDDGIFLLIEPRDAEGQMIAAAGPISVVLLDRGLPGEAARVARWDLTAHQAAAYFRRMPAGDGIYLELPWPSAPPVHSHLHLFVRFTTRDGRNLEANRELDITLAGQAPAVTLAGADPRPLPLWERANQPPLSLWERDGVRAASPPPEAAASWQARALPRESVDERPTGETPVPLTPPSDQNPLDQEEVPAAEHARQPAATESPQTTPLSTPPERSAHRSASNDPGPRIERPVWSPFRR